MRVRPGRGRIAAVGPVGSAEAEDGMVNGAATTIMAIDAFWWVCRSGAGSDGVLVERRRSLVVDRGVRTAKRHQQETLVSAPAEKRRLRDRLYAVGGADAARRPGGGSLPLNAPAAYGDDSAPDPGSATS